MHQSRQHRFPHQKLKTIHGQSNGTEVDKLSDQLVVDDRLLGHSYHQQSAR